MAAKRLSFYVMDTDVTIRSDHLPMKKFLNKQVNNWAVELEQFRLQLDWIPGSQNLLVDSLSRLLDMIPDAQQPEEAKNHEFGSYCFEELEPVKTLETVATEIIELQVQVRETVDCSQKLWKLNKKDDSNEEITESFTEQTKVQADDSEFSEYSQNSRNRNGVGIFELKYNEQPSRKPNLLGASEPGKHSRNSQMDYCIKLTEHEEVKEIKLPLKTGQLQELQKNNAYCRDVARKLHKKVEMQKIFIKEKGILYRLWVEDGRTFKCILVPEVLQDFMIILAHNYSGHNGSRRTYSCLK